MKPIIHLIIISTLLAIPITLGWFILLNHAPVCSIDDVGCIDDTPMFAGGLITIGLAGMAVVILQRIRMLSIE